MTILSRYVGSRFIFYFALVLAAMTALALTLELMEQADNVLRASSDGSLALLRYSGLRAPDIIAQMLPIATLLGMLFALAQLMRHSEMVAMWASGVSPMTLIRGMLPVALALGAVALINNDLAVPQAQGVLRSMGFAGEGSDAFSAGEGEVQWLLSGSDIVRLPKLPPSGEPLEDISIFRRAPDGKLTERLDARRASAQGEGWMLTGVTRYPVEPATSSTLPELYWNGHIDLAALPLIARDMRELGSRQLMHLIKHEGYGQLPTDRFRTWLHARIASAVVPSLMIFLVVSLAQRFRRSGAFGPLLLFSVGIGFAYFILDGICLTMGEEGLLPSWFAAWSPKLALASLVGSIISFVEG